MSKYRKLIENPPILQVKDNAREGVITLVSCMCDKDDIEWAADDSKWADVFSMINSGTSKIESIKSR